MPKEHKRRKSKIEYKTSEEMRDLDFWYKCVGDLRGFGAEKRVFEAYNRLFETPLHRRPQWTHWMNDYRPATEEEDGILIDGVLSTRDVGLFLLQFKTSETGLAYFREKRKILRVPVHGVIVPGEGCGDLEVLGAIYGAIKSERSSRLHQLSKNQNRISFMSRIPTSHLVGA